MTDAEQPAVIPPAATPATASAIRTHQICLTIVIIALSLWMAWEFLTPLAWAAVLAIAEWPLYRRALAHAPSRPMSIAVGFALATGFLVILPLSLAAVTLIQGKRRGAGVAEACPAIRHRRAGLVAGHTPVRSPHGCVLAAACRQPAGRQCAARHVQRGLLARLVAFDRQRGRPRIGDIPGHLAGAGDVARARRSHCRSGTDHRAADVWRVRQRVRPSDDGRSAGDGQRHRAGLRRRRRDHRRRLCGGGRAATAAVRHLHHHAGAGAVRGRGSPSGWPARSC